MSTRSKTRTEKIDTMTATPAGGSRAVIVMNTTMETIVILEDTMEVLTIPTGPDTNRAGTAQRTGHAAKDPEDGNKMRQLASTGTRP